MVKPTVETGLLFDQPFYVEINEARWKALEVLFGIEVLATASTCIDVGCGPGWFSRRLHDRGYVVSGLDGRTDLLDEARRRVPEATFRCCDVQSQSAVSGLDAADLVFCFGLIYHVENPFRVVRNLALLTREVLLLEGIVVPGTEPIARIMDEGRNATQGLSHIAMVPTRPALVKMLYSAGFPNVYRYLGSVPHDDFRETPDRFRRREIYVCSRAAIAHSELALERLPDTPKIQFDRIQGSGTTTGSPSMSTQKRKWRLNPWHICRSEKT